jgi:hypothetical protein
MDMTAALQFEIDFDTPPPDASVDVAIAVLEQQKTWLKAADLLRKLNEAPSETNKRKLRRISEHSQGKIISGQKGYKHIRHATPEEITHAANWLRHQAKEMDQRATEILKQYHQLPHTPK